METQSGATYLDPYPGLKVWNSYGYNIDCEQFSYVFSWVVLFWTRLFHC